MAPRGKENPLQSINFGVQNLRFPEWKNCICFATSNLGKKLLSKKINFQKSRLGAFRWHIFGHLGLSQIHPTKMEGTNYAAWHADIHQITDHTLSSPPLHPLPSQDDLAWHNKQKQKWSNKNASINSSITWQLRCLRLVDQFQERKHKVASSFTSICLGKRKAAAACRRNCPRLVFHSCSLKISPFTSLVGGFSPIPIWKVVKLDCVPR